MEDSQVFQTQEVFRILDEIKQAGCLWLLLSGGEPLLCKDLIEHLEQLNEIKAIIKG